MAMQAMHPAVRDVFWLAAVLALCSVTACATSEMKEFTRGTITVGMAPDYPPLVFEKNGRIVGIEPDFVAMLEKDSGERVRLQRLAWEALIPALEQGRIDVIMSGMS
ncbi:MAG: transporter substrate-binding domain-containing protein, partial [Pseudomonadota bacterium]